MDKKEKRKIVDSIVPKCTADAKCEDRHNKHGDFVFELRQIISAHRWEDEWGAGINDEEGMARKIIGLVLDNIPDNSGPK